ncbi:MAG TPA: TMEM43 family protein [Patescibacteria group bacterium]|nr:TMEM43 family protein [Patescibacteria group bacterium]
MPDQIVETSTTGWLQRILNSFLGILIGLLLFVGSFVLLYWNEGHFDLSKDAKKAVQVTATQSPDAGLNGKLIAATGPVTSTETLGDGLYLKPIHMLALTRKAEIFEWNESQQSSSKTNIGGSNTTTTTYTYALDWTDTPHDSSEFKNPAGHQNPKKTIEDTTLRVKSAQIGNYVLDMQTIDLPSFSPIPLDQNNTIVEVPTTVSPDYVYTGHGTLAAPQLGDMRVSYTGLADNTTLTAMGSQDNTMISSYYDAGGHKLYRLFEGSLGNAVATLHKEYQLWVWIFRGVGFLLMWIGLMLFFGPISVILDVLPVFGGISRGAIGFLTFLLSVVLSGVTIVVSILLHSIIFLIGAVVVAFLIFMGVAHAHRVSTRSTSAKV